ncbi:MAG: hypothetical protein KDB27_03875 [Planctomycetales bacterium]|nr:hypothetical protein [Planctomycetales bacterium]
MSSEPFTVVQVDAVGGTAGECPIEMAGERATEVFNEIQQAVLQAGQGFEVPATKHAS